MSMNEMVITTHKMIEGYLACVAAKPFPYPRIPSAKAAKSKSPNNTI